MSLDIQLREGWMRATKQFDGRVVQSQCVIACVWKEMESTKASVRVTVYPRCSGCTNFDKNGT